MDGFAGRADDGGSGDRAGAGAGGSGGVAGAAGSVVGFSAGCAVSGNEKALDVEGFFGQEDRLNKIFAKGATGKGLIDLGSTSSSKGEGTVKRSEQLVTDIAAVVTQVLPNGNLVIEGKQEVRVNFELRELVVSGIVRPEDIARDNSIRHSQIAEARISYGGRGQLTDAQQARWGQQIYDALFPF